MDIKINKDIASEYPDDAYKGFSVKQILCICIAGALGTGIILTLYYVVGLNIHTAVYAAFPAAAPVILIGFIKYKGMFLVDALKEWVRLQDQPVMIYEAEENHYDCCEVLLVFEEEKRRETERRRRKKKQGYRRQSKKQKGECDVRRYI